MMKQFLLFAVFACMAVTALATATTECLASANSYRRKHKKTENLQWDAGLAREAQAYAETLLRNGGNLVHSNTKAGENLAVNYADTASDAGTVCRNADKRWYAEIKDYNWLTGRSNGGAVGHFTQMVWFGSKRVGYGVAVGRSPQQWNPNTVTSIRVVVARYMPAGNYVGRSLKNVYSLCGGDCPRPEPVSCGNHRASKCSGCPQGNGAKWCNGDCKWCNGACQLKGMMCPEAYVSCGKHRASKCSGCPQGNGAAWCNGNCKWCNGACQLKGMMCPAAVNGKWGRWRRWSPYVECSKTCGEGTQRRRRVCDNVNVDVCAAAAVNGKWGRWSPYGKCSKTCGGGRQRRRRVCDNPKLSNGGRPCAGPPLESRECNSEPCAAAAVNGAWGSWSAYGECSKTCGGGKKWKKRVCDNPEPSNGGRSCPGFKGRSRKCNRQSCTAAVNGEWGSWSAYGECSKTCGGGRKRRRRVCDNPEPSNGGRSCPGLPFENRRCNMDPCSEKTCDDNKEYDCGDWAKDGECEASPQWMKQNCCKSCSTAT